jgi:hypothetical protein
VQALKARVQNGRIVVDEPTSLPEGTELDLLMADQEDGASAADEGGRTPGTLAVLTWNLHKNPNALDLACKHLKELGSFVAAFQELPENGDATFWLTKATGQSKLKVLSRGMLKLVGHGSDLRVVHPKTVLIASDDIDIDLLGKSHEYKSAIDDQRRLEGFTLRSREWQNLQVMGVHGWDRFSRSSSEERSDWAALMRSSLDEFWDGGPLIVMGDLNASPWSAEVTGRRGLYALRRKDWPTERQSKLVGRDRYVTPLYNPMWQILPDAGSGGHETIYHPDEHDLRWHCFDQIIVSEHLRAHCGLPVVLTTLAGCNLIDDKGAPRRHKDGFEFSQHLPVQMTIDLRKVEPCRISAAC